ncbi:hypothetical protein PF007_g24995 [Phytophthora fragariae]|uniref:Uncharacterized protein n=1 Tax=Phytophthora fragariae TaxID=53985 RepID=A0A6A3QH16_9STRA|nr:hypothetical protein PF007_g24995 [Phytophthora fragariae]
MGGDASTSVRFRGVPKSSSCMEMTSYGTLKSGTTVSFTLPPSLCGVAIRHLAPQASSTSTTTLMQMQMQQHSPASSYAETDCADSDSDDSGCGDCHIPASGRRQPHPHQCVSIAEGLDLSYHADMRLLRAGRYLHKHDDDLDCEQELDEDDPAFYGNLAFFRLQCGVQLRVVRRSAHPLKAPAAPASPSAVDDRDEDIFAMEL